MFRIPYLTFSALVLSALSIMRFVPANADTVSDFYRGKNVNMIVGYEPGGTYDIWARLIARHLGKHIPGNPAVIVQYMPGAGSMTASNHIYNVALRDGTVMGLMSSANPFAPMLGMGQAKFDPLKFTWLGTPTLDTAVIPVWHTAPVNTLEDATKTEVILGSSSPNGTTGFYGRIFNDIFHTKFKVVYGYSINEAFLAMERGEIIGHPSTFWSFMKSAKADLVRDKKVKFLTQFGGKPNPDIVGVPFARDSLKSEESLKLFDAAIAPLSIGYPFLMGPDIPEERAAAMRKAYTETFRDPLFIADAAKQNLDIVPVNGEEIGKIVNSAYLMPKQLIDRMKALYEAN
jgi:hypothetical protein